jgi:hypothetical protein
VEAPLIDDLEPGESATLAVLKAWRLLKDPRGWLQDQVKHAAWASPKANSRHWLPPSLRWWAAEHERKNKETEELEERLLADRVVMCWLQLYYAEQKYAEMALADGPIVNWTQEEWHQKRIDRLQRRYIAAIKGLAQVRKLLKPSMQGNVAEQQVNVSGDLGKS